MSLSVAGVWAAGVWDPTVWASCVWSEPGCATTVATGQTPAGRAIRERRERYEVAYRNSIHRFYDAPEAIAFLLSIQEREVRTAKTQARADAKRILATGKISAQDRREYVPRFIAAEAAVSILGADIFARIERAYDNALMAALAREADDDDDLELIMELL